jgi:hypothetical protein
MPDEFNIEVEGVEECVRLFEDAPREAIPPALLHALMAGSQVIEEYIAGRTPDKTGEMLEDLDTTTTLDSDFRGGVAAIGFSRAQGDIARFLEYGHREVGHKPLKKPEGYYSPHAFMRPAAEAAADPAVDTFDETLMGDLAQAGIIDGD